MKSSKLLLDTHVFLWWRAEPDRLEASARKAISTADIVFVSAVSAWEAGVKSALGRLKLPTSVEIGVDESGFEKLPILFAHAETAAALPPHHQDPFDRMLIGQAICEQLTLVTHDRRMEPYEIHILWT